MIRAVIFDLGGTLLEFNPQHLPWLEWERAGLENAHAYLLEQGHTLSEEAFTAHFEDMLPERWERAAQGGDNLRLGDVLRESCVACGIVPTPGEIEALIARYIAPLDARVTIYDDTLDTLDALRRRGLKIGLISNSMWPGEYHRRELERYGLLPYFEHIVFSADAAIWKPQPGIYYLVLDALRVSAEEAIYVGDMPEYDIVGAQSAGMRAVLKCADGHSPEDIRPDATIVCLAELLTAIGGWGIGVRPSFGS